MAAATLEEKINKIRQKNEEIRRRHEEVEADKQNAAKLNALVKMVPPTDWPERKEPPEFSNPPPPRSNGNHKAKLSGREHRGQQQQYHAAGGEGKKTHVFAEGDGPPPDPTYNFLADSEREERTREDSRDNDRFRGRGGPLRGGSRKRGGGREGYSKEYRGSPAGPKDSSKPEYEAWRAERNRIDEARISRQRTAEGNWRREWDNNKTNTEEGEAGATKTARLDTGDTVRKEHKEFDKWQNEGADHDSPRGRGGKPYVSRGSLRGSHNNRVYQHSNSFDQFLGPASPPPTKPPISPNGIDERTVVATDKSIKVIVNHGSTTPKGPVMSVKVSSSSIAGTGRVGPRQKPRVLYSSQSESEVPCVEQDKYFSHKSPDDKTNRVSFNRDKEEQQRYVANSTHPQRKAENNPKSPYLSRKEFKYDSQQQRHEEIDPKSLYQQRKDIKDSSKSPHFQKKADFINRESHAKQKNNNLGNDSLKYNNTQRRTTEKSKQDSQKFNTPKKQEENLSNPKPQRINKRNDKSKNFQHSNSKESQESNTNENNTQLNKLDANKLEEPVNNVAADVAESLDGVDDTKNDSDKEISEDSVAVETLDEKQHGDVTVLDLNINSETLGSSIGLRNLEENVPEDKKSIDNLESVVLPDADVDQSPVSVIVSNNDDEEEINVENVEINTVAEDPSPKLMESETVEDNENVKDVVASEKLAEIPNGVEEKLEIPKNIENNMCDDKTEEIKNISVEESKREESSTPEGDPKDVEKLEKKTGDIKTEFESEKKCEISVEPEEIVDELPQIQDTKSNEEEKKLDSVAPEVETSENNKEQISENIDSEVIKDSEHEEKSII